jgi:dUTPase
MLSDQVIVDSECMLASKFMIDTGAGVIDADYRGVVFVLLFNHSDTDFEGSRSNLCNC